MTVFAYKVSPEGRARAAKELSRRKLEAKEAALDGTVSIMADLRDIIIARELKLRTRALTLSALAIESQISWIKESSRLVINMEVRKFLAERERERNEAREEAEMRVEEEEQRRREFVAAQIAKAKAEAEAAAKAKAEKEAREAAEEAERQRLQFIAEAKAALRRRKRAEALKRATIQAAKDWEYYQEEVRLQAWTKFCKDKPKRVKLYFRMRMAVTKNSASEKKDVYEQPPDLREETFMNNEFQVFLGRTAGKNETRKEGVDKNNNNNNKKNGEEMEATTMMMMMMNENGVEKKKDEKKRFMSKSAQPLKRMTVAASTAKRGGEGEVGELMLLRKSR